MAVIMNDVFGVVDTVIVFIFDSVVNIIIIDIIIIIINIIIIIINNNNIFGFVEIDISVKVDVVELTSIGLASTMTTTISK